MDIINPLAQAYAERYSEKEDPLLKQISDETFAGHPDPHMLSGHLQGRLLTMISQIIQPRRILEVGSFTGYSAISLAKGLLNDGLLHTIELREADAAICAENFRRANLQDRIILHSGNALDIIPGLQEDWDLVFLDADKPGYINYYELVMPRLRTGGVILADNVLFHGQVLEDEVKGKSAKAIQAFNDHVEKDDRVEKVMLTVRDGLYMIRKK